MSENKEPIFPRLPESGEQKRAKLREQAKQNLEAEEQNYQPDDALETKAFCPSCRAENSAADAFCTVCGTPLNLQQPFSQQNGDIYTMVYGPPPMNLTDDSPVSVYGSPPLNLTGNSISGKISLILALVNVLLFIFAISVSFVTRNEGIIQIWLLLSPILALTGIVTGAVALFTNRAWAGLALNILLLAGSFLIYGWMFTRCCAQPPLTY